MELVRRRERQREKVFSIHWNHASFFECILCFQCKILWKTFWTLRVSLYKPTIVLDKIHWTWIRSHTARCSLVLFELVNRVLTYCRKETVVSVSISLTRIPLNLHQNQSKGPNGRETSLFNSRLWNSSYSFILVVSLFYCIGTCDIKITTTATSTTKTYVYNYQST